MENISVYIDRLIEEKGFSDKDPEIVNQIKADLQSRLEDRINAMILANLPADGIEDFEKVLDADDEDAISAYVARQIPDFDEKVATELLVFRTMYLA
jgi:hypothetical protein